MKVYFTDKQVPEMSGFVLSQRSIIRRGAFDLFCREHLGARFWVPLANGVAVGISLPLAHAVCQTFWIFLVVAMTLAYLIMVFYQSMLTERLRPYFRRYIEESRDARLVR